MLESQRLIRSACRAMAIMQLLFLLRVVIGVSRVLRRYQVVVAVCTPRELASGTVLLCPSLAQLPETPLSQGQQQASSALAVAAATRLPLNLLRSGSFGGRRK